MKPVTIYYQIHNSDMAYCSTTVGPMCDFHSSKEDFDLFVSEFEFEGPVQLVEVTEDNVEELRKQGAFNEVGM